MRGAPCSIRGRPGARPRRTAPLAPGPLPACRRRRASRTLDGTHHRPICCQPFSLVSFRPCWRPASCTPPALCTPRAHGKAATPWPAPANRRARTSPRASNGGRRDRTRRSPHRTSRDTGGGRRHPRGAPRERRPAAAAPQGPTLPMSSCSDVLSQRFHAILLCSTTQAARSSTRGRPPAPSALLSPGGALAAGARRAAGWPGAARRMLCAQPATTDVAPTRRCNRPGRAGANLLRQRRRRCDIPRLYFTHIMSGPRTAPNGQLAGEQARGTAPAQARERPAASV